MNLKDLIENVKSKIATIIENFWLWKCKKFGHSFNDWDVLIFRIRTSALNRDMSATLKCKHCKQEFTHKDAR